MGVSNLRRRRLSLPVDSHPWQALVSPSRKGWRSRAVAIIVVLIFLLRYLKHTRRGEQPQSFPGETQQAWRTLPSFVGEYSFFPLTIQTAKISIHLSYT